MTSFDGLRVEPLCVHHDLAGFESGKPERNLTARNLASRIRNLDSYDFSAIVAVVPDVGVVGIAAVVDVFLEGDRDEEGNEVQGRCLLLAFGCRRPSEAGGYSRRVIINEAGRRARLHIFQKSGLHSRTRGILRGPLAFELLASRARISTPTNRLVPAEKCC